MDDAGGGAAQQVERQEAPCPMRSSTLSPKIQRYHRLLIRCSQPPCKNTEVSSGRASLAVRAVQSPVKFTGTTPYCWKRKASPSCPSEFSCRKTATLVTISASVTNG